MSSRQNHSHAHFQDLLEMQISGAPLAPDDRMALFDHVETCDECRFMLEAEERLTARMKTVPRLMAPSDLRSKILNQAIRDHQERTTTPSEDPALADVLTTKANVAPGSTTTDGLSSDEMPVFAGLEKAMPSRRRLIWQRASPVLATGFLTVAAVGALYTGQFQGIPLAGEAQKIVWAAIDSASGRQPLPTSRPESSVALADTTLGNDGIGLGSSEPVIAYPAPVPPAELNLKAEAIAPLPGTAKLLDGIRTARVWMASADSTLGALARAAQSPIPGPAEEATPQIAALVLRPTDATTNPGGFQQSELADTLETLATSQPGARMASSDQFAEDGRRYRLYTLELPAGATTQLVNNLTPYRSPADSAIVSTLVSQDPGRSARNQNLQFYSSNNATLRTALETISPVATSSRHERLRVVVVE